MNRPAHSGSSPAAAAETGERRRSFHGQGAQRELSLTAARAAVIEQASALVRAQAPAPERRKLGELMRDFPARMLAEAVTADRDWPPFRRAMRDGYALRAAEATPGPLRCSGQVRAGDGGNIAVDAGACVEIMTGAPVPAEADTVVMIEHTRRSGEQVWFDLPLRPGDNIALPGSDTPAGSVVAAAGYRLTPPAIAALAQAGCTEPEVFPRPRVAVVSTGEELVEATAKPGPGRIRNSNGPMLVSLCVAAGAELALVRHIGDAAGELNAVLESLPRDTDIVVCTGGASVGAHDGVAPALAALGDGAEVYFDAVAMRPGRPQWFARLKNHASGGAARERLFFGLPGNPLGAWLGFTLLVRPAIELLGGLDPSRIRAGFSPAQLGFDFRHKPLPLTVFRPVLLEEHEIEAPTIHDLPYHGSADLTAAAAADAWMVIPPSTSFLAAGTAVTVMRP